MLSDNQPLVYPRSVNDMLKGTKKRRDVVVDNLWRAPIVITNDSPHPGERPHFTMPGAEDLLRDLVWRRAQVLYGTPLPCPLFRRLNTEWLAICQNGHASLYWLAHLLVQESEQNGYHTEPYGSAGSSFVAFLAGITHINPLPPHYRCPQCRYTEFSEAAACGYDLPEKLCPRCKTVLERDGQDLSAEIFMGLHGEIRPAFELNFAVDYPPMHDPHFSLRFGCNNIDMLENDAPNIYRFLEQYTGRGIAEVDFADPRVYALFSSPAELGVSAEKIGYPTGTLGLPEWGQYEAETAAAAAPHNFADLVSLSARLHSFVDEERTVSLGFTASLDDLFTGLIQQGVDRKNACGIVHEIIRKPCNRDFSRLAKCGLSQERITALENICALPSKAQIVTYCRMAFRLAWFKLYYPAEYYAAYLNGRQAFLSAVLFQNGSEGFKAYYEQTYQSEKPSGINGIYLCIAYEAICRGIRFLPVDLNCSAPKTFTLVNGAIRLPLASLRGMNPEQVKAAIQG